MSEVNKITRKQENVTAFDEMTLEEVIAMHDLGLDFICGDGHIEVIEERVKW